MVNKKKYIILSEKSWNKELLAFFKENLTKFDWILINNKSDFNLEELKKINPDKIFIPHWSYIIPSEILNKFDCIVFHMTDLPFGRGGSPLQNLIVSGFNKTKVSALKVVEELDAGPIYLQKELPLFGTAEEIFIRANLIIKSMIVEIIENNIKPKNQKGEVVCFKRRKPEDSSIINLSEIEQVYDYIRMLDADGYPKAYIENEYFRFEFSRASMKSNGEIIADVKIKINKR